jgi:type VI secretion system secreted protein VgrG
MYNGKQKSGFATPNNDLKVIQSRIGCKIVMNDTTGSVLTQDAFGNKVFMDGKGNTTIDASNDITINAGKNMSINVGQNLTIHAGMNISETAGANKNSDIKGLYSLKVGLNYMIHVLGKMNIFSKGDIESHTDKQMSEIAKDGISTNSEGAIEKHSKKEIKVNSTEKSKLF